MVTLEILHWDVLEGNSVAVQVLAIVVDHFFPDVCLLIAPRSMPDHPTHPDAMVENTSSKLHLVIA
jgi:hypothetical protein